LTEIFKGFCGRQVLTFPLSRRDILVTMIGHQRYSFRLVGFLPLVFFIAQVIHYWRFGGLGNLLWMCNVGNLLLAVGLFLDHRELIRAASIWTIPGLVIWVKYVLLDYGFLFSSTVAHVGGLIVGVIALRRVGMDRTAWLYAFAWSLFMQITARLLTSPELNVNVSHSIPPGWERYFNSYWKFWLIFNLVIGSGLWGLGKILSFLWPRPARIGAEIQTA
jgi:hypothetical protein